MVRGSTTAFTDRSSALRCHAVDLTRSVRYFRNRRVESGPRGYRTLILGQPGMGVLPQMSQVLLAHLSGMRAGVGRGKKGFEARWWGRLRVAAVGRHRTASGSRQVRAMSPARGGDRTRADDRAGTDHRHEGPIRPIWATAFLETRARNSAGFGGSRAESAGDQPRTQAPHAPDPSKRPLPALGPEVRGRGGRQRIRRSGPRRGARQTRARPGATRRRAWPEC